MHLQDLIVRFAVVASVLAVILASSMQAQDDVPRVTDENVVFLYESRADVRTPDDQLARRISSDYRDARDEFTKYDLMQQIKPVLERRLSEAKVTEKVFLSIGGRLEDYNFEKMAFPTGFGEGTFVPFINPYAVTFSNGSDLSELPIPLDKARALSGQLQNSRNVSFTVTGEIIGVKEGALNYSSKKQLEVRVTQVKVAFQNGSHIATINF